MEFKNAKIYDLKQLDDGIGLINVDSDQELIGQMNLKTILIHLDNVAKNFNFEALDCSFILKHGSKCTVLKTNLDTPEKIGDNILIVHLRTPFDLSDYLPIALNYGKPTNVFFTKDHGAFEMTYEKKLLFKGVWQI